MKKISNIIEKIKSNSYYRPKSLKSLKFDKEIDYKKEYKKLLKEYQILKEEYSENIYKKFLDRRSVRRFARDKKPDFETIYKIIEAGTSCPIAGNIQNFRIILIEKKELKKEVATCAYQQYWICDAPYLLAIVRDDSELMDLYADNGKLFSIQNVTACIENIVMMIHFYNLSTCWVGVGDNDAMRNILKVPENQTVDAIIPIGYGLEKPEPPIKMTFYNLLYFNYFNERQR